MLDQAPDAATPTVNPTFGKLLARARIGGGTPHRQPERGRLVLASVVALAGSLVADALLVALGEAVFPSTEGFVHFRFPDYATLTVLGVLAACAAWPVVTRLSFAPRWLFVRLAVLVTVLVWLPDLWLLLRHEPPRGVAVLAVMHLAIALVTYNSLVHLAPVRPAVGDGPPPAVGDGPSERAGSAAVAASGGASGAAKSVWVAMSVLTFVELALGVAALLSVPFGRSTSLLPHHGEVAYLVHALAGMVLAVGAVAVLAASWHAERVLRVAAVVALVSLAVAGGGGALAVYHSLRIAGAGLMLVGGMVAALAYLTPVIEAPPAQGADVPGGSDGATLSDR